MNRLLGVLFGLLLLGLTTTGAHAWHGDVGYIEICKAANPELSGQFRFAIDDGRVREVDVEIGTCTPPIPVAAGSVTVTELGWVLPGNAVPVNTFLQAEADAVGPLGPLPAMPPGFAYTVQVPQGGKEDVVTVTFRDKLVTGVIEVCKKIVPDSGLMGSWSFRITAANNFGTVVTAPTGACSPPRKVPAGEVTVQEVGDAVAVVLIDANRPILNRNYAAGSATVVVNPGDASQQTIVTFTDNSVRLKLCKFIDQGLTNTGPYSFTFTTSGPPGPNGPIEPMSIPAGIVPLQPLDTDPPLVVIDGSESGRAGCRAREHAVCKVVGPFRAGTKVGITEGVVPGTKVGSIDVEPTDRVVGGAADLANRTVMVVLGPGETIVTFGDIPAKDGFLKLCKVADPSPPPIPPGTVFNFTVSDGIAPRSVDVAEGSCAMLMPYPYNTTLQVVEAPMKNVRVKDIAAVPTYVRVLVGNRAVDTNQLVLANVALTARSVSVTIGEDNITELTYTNVDPPPAVTTGARPASANVTRSRTSAAGAARTARTTTTGTATLPLADIQKAISEAQAANHQAALAKLVAVCPGGDPSGRCRTSKK
jgi:hypothetical protein